VAVVIAGDRSVCVDWHSGMTGSEALVAAADVTWGNRAPYVGMVLQIDSRPANPDPQQAYWAYFRNGVYSSAGPASTKPAAGSVEGWSYVPADGSTPPPPSGSYASICAGQDPTPAPSRPRSSTPRPPASSTRHAPATSSPARTGHPVTMTAGASHGGNQAAGTSGASTSGSAAPRPTATPSSAPASPGDAASSNETAQSGTAGTVPASSTAAVLAQAAHRPDQTSRSAFPPWGTALAVGAIAVLGGAGYWFSRRRAGP
jgi:hypothetical protein